MANRITRHLTSRWKDLRNIIVESNLLFKRENTGKRKKTGKENGLSAKQVNNPFAFYYLVNLAFDGLWLMISSPALHELLCVSKTLRELHFF